jgi:hypothetical protein
VIGGYELLATLDTLPVRLTRERPNQDCQIIADIRLRISNRRRVKTSLSLIYCLQLTGTARIYRIPRRLGDLHATWESSLDDPLHRG